MHFIRAYFLVFMLVFGSYFQRIAKLHAVVALSGQFPVMVASWKRRLSSYRTLSWGEIATDVETSFTKNFYSGFVFIA